MVHAARVSTGTTNHLPHANLCLPCRLCARGESPTSTGSIECVHCTGPPQNRDCTTGIPFRTMETKLTSTACNSFPPFPMRKLPAWNKVCSLPQPPEHLAKLLRGYALRLAPIFDHVQGSEQREAGMFRLQQPASGSVIGDHRMAPMNCESRYVGLSGIQDPFQSNACHQLDITFPGQLHDHATYDELRQAKRDFLRCPGSIPGTSVYSASERDARSETATG